MRSRRTRSRRNQMRRRSSITRIRSASPIAPIDMRPVRPNTINQHLAKMRLTISWRSVPGIIWSNWLS
jgi:hypothetical protein